GGFPDQPAAPARDTATLAGAAGWFCSINCAVFAGCADCLPADSTVFSLHTDPASSNLNNTSAEVRSFLFRRTIQLPLDRNEWLDSVNIGSKRSLSEEVHHEPLEVVRPSGPGSARPRPRR